MKEIQAAIPLNDEDWRPKVGDEVWWLPVYKLHGLDNPPARVKVIGIVGDLFRIKRSNGRRREVTIDVLKRIK